MYKLFTEVKADVFVDLTIPEVGYQHTLAALKNGLRPVVGTSGFTEDEINTLRNLAKEKELGAIIAPNFAVGAVLMMEFSDRKSTRLNSSHVAISYAVFCLKKKIIKTSNI